MDREVAREAAISEIVNRNDDGTLCDRLSCLANTLSAAKEAYDAGHATATAEAEGRLRVLAEALERIKDRVCGEAMPNWTTDIVTTGSRLYIADLCDHALQAALKEATKYER